MSPHPQGQTMQSGSTTREAEIADLTARVYQLETGHDARPVKPALVAE
jgi:hypothetical protein